jgi:hypothetical protein
VDLFFRITAFARAVSEDHILKLAFAPFVANGAIERMVGKQEFEGVLASAGYLGSFGADDHALGDGKGAGRHHLGHFFDFDQTHAAVSINRKVGMIAVVRYLYAVIGCSLDDCLARLGFYFLSV